MALQQPSRADAVRNLGRLGFRKWYEKQLVESHLWLAACVLCMIMVAIGFELLADKKTPGDLLLDSLMIFCGCLGGWFSWRRYATVLFQAEAVGEQANCPACKHYGFRVETSPPAYAREYQPMLTARCPKCQHRWPVTG
jgi:hypothetical protein